MDATRKYTVTNVIGYAIGLHSIFWSRFLDSRISVILQPFCMIVGEFWSCSILMRILLHLMASKRIFK